MYVHAAEKIHSLFHCYNAEPLLFIANMYAIHRVSVFRNGPPIIMEIHQALDYECAFDQILSMRKKEAKSVML